MPLEAVMFLFLMKYVPGAAFMWYRVIRPIWNGIVANIEALWYIRHRSAAKAELQQLKDTVLTVHNLADWYAIKGFSWSPDPWNGRIDFRSKPWVSVYKLTGDCDDMMELAYYLLRGRYKRTVRISVYSEIGQGHAVVAFETDDGLWRMMTNTSFRTFTSLEDAINATYVDRTTFAYTY